MALSTPAQASLPEFVCVKIDDVSHAAKEIVCLYGNDGKLAMEARVGNQVACRESWFRGWCRQNPRTFFEIEGAGAWVIARRTDVPGWETKYGEEWTRRRLAWGLSSVEAVAKPVLNKEQTYDGLTAAGCLMVYENNMNAADLGRKPIAMTRLQKSVACNEWRAALLTKKADAEKKERERVVVDLQFEEWE